MNDPSPWPLLLYVDLVMLAFGVAFIAAGLRAVKTKSIPVRGGGTQTGPDAVTSGWGYVVCGSIVAIGGLAAMIAALLFS
jgi:hypothetical protein